MLIDDLFGNGQSQAGAAVALGGMEQLEHMVHHRRGDARSVVDDFND